MSRDFFGRVTHNFGGRADGQMPFFVMSFVLFEIEIDFLLTKHRQKYSMDESYCRLDD